MTSWFLAQHSTEPHQRGRVGSSKVHASPPNPPRTHGEGKLQVKGDFRKTPENSTCDLQ